MKKQETNTQKEMASKLKLKARYAKAEQKNDKERQRKKLGKKLFIYFVILHFATLAMDIVLTKVFRLLQGTIFDKILDFVEAFDRTLDFIGATSIFGIIISLLIWFGKNMDPSLNRRNHNRRDPFVDMSILDPRNPGSPNYWNK